MLLQIRKCQNPQRDRAGSRGNALRRNLGGSATVAAIKLTNKLPFRPGLPWSPSAMGFSYSPTQAITFSSTAMGVGRAPTSTVVRVGWLVVNASA